MEDKANNAITRDLQEKYLSVKKAVAKVLRVLEKSHNYRVNAEMKDRSTEVNVFVGVAPKRDFQRDYNIRQQ